MNKPQPGFTLIELLTTLAIVGLIAAIAFPAYQQHIIRTRQSEARAALIENAHFMERWYAETGDYKQDGNSWPTLPVSGTEVFDINFSASARNTDDGHYLIQAKPKRNANWLGEAFLEIDEDGNVKYCTEPGPSKKCSLRVL